MNDESEITEEIITPLEECECEDCERVELTDFFLLLVVIPAMLSWYAAHTVEGLIRKLNPWSKTKS